MASKDTIAIVYPRSAATPTGLQVILIQLLTELRRRGCGIQLLLAKSKQPFGHLLLSMAVECYQGLDSELTVRWLSADLFEAEHRARLRFELERITPRPSRWFFFGTGKAGLVGSLVAEQDGTPCTTLITADDVLCRLMTSPAELATCLRCSSLVLVANPRLLDLISAFFPEETARLRTEGRLRHIDVAEPELASADVEPGAYVCSSGAFGDLEDLGELVARVVTVMQSTGASQWLHLGTVAPGIVGRLAGLLSLHGLSDRFNASGFCASEDHVEQLRGGRALLVPSGEVDTGLSVRLANRIGLPVSAPSEFPFEIAHPLHAAGTPSDLLETIVVTAFVEYLMG